MIQKIFRRIYLIPILVLILSLLSVGMLLWVNDIKDREQKDFALTDAINDVRIRVANFHLWFEETLAGNPKIDKQKVWEDYEWSLKMTEVILNGGERYRGHTFEPFGKSGRRSQLEDLKSLLIKFGEIGRQRMQPGVAVGVSSELNHRFDEVYVEFQKVAASMGTFLERRLVDDETEARNLFFIFCLVWAGIGLATTIGLWSREGKRKIAEEALRQTNEQLRLQTEELEQHREQLKELVEEGTTKLTSTNRTLEQEIFERKQVEKSLLASENQCRILVDFLPQKIFLKDSNSVYVYSNESFARDLDIEATAISGKTDFDLFPPEYAEKNRSEDKKIRETGKPLDIRERQVREGEEVIIHKFEMPIRNKEGEITGLLGFTWDVTERVRLEAVAAAVTTMNNIGYVFEGLRHEIGNPIASTKLSLSVLKKRIDTLSKEAIEEYVERVSGEIGKVEYLLNTLKSFNMYETPQLQNVALKPFMDKFLSLLAVDFEKRKGINIQTTFAPQAQWGYVDPRALQQILINIASNAYDALDGRENPRIVIEVLKASNCIKIRMTDNGCGIPAEKLKRLYSPFFTTKPSGTGMGLVIATKLLSGMGGSLAINTRRGEGTSVELSIREGRDE